MTFKKEDFGSIAMIGDLLGELSWFGETFRLIMVSDDSIYSPARLLEDGVIPGELISGITSKLEKRRKIKKKINECDDKAKKSGGKLELEKIDEGIVAKLMEVFTLLTNYFEMHAFSNEASPLVQRVRVLSLEDETPYNALLEEFKSRFYTELVQEKIRLNRKSALKSLIDMGTAAECITPLLDSKYIAGSLDSTAEKLAINKRNRKIYLGLIKSKKRILDELVSQEGKINLNFSEKNIYRYFIFHFNFYLERLNYNKEESTLDGGVAFLGLMLSAPKLTSFLPTQEEINQTENLLNKANEGLESLNSLSCPKPFKEVLSSPLSKQERRNTIDLGVLTTKSNADGLGVLPTKSSLEVTSLKDLCVKSLRSTAIRNYQFPILVFKNKESHRNSGKKPT